MSKKETKKPSGPPPSGFAIPRENYRIIIAGAALVLIGMLLMVGGASDDPNKFNGDELFSFRRITLSPIVILVGFIVVFFAIMKKPKPASEEETDQPG